ncbi:hypothetical protein EB72_09530 [Mycobacterium sp. SWH-M1]|nr:hypothetical protein EB72_09530 [Mycobacterium sp. SWH-M1]
MVDRVDAHREVGHDPHPDRTQRGRGSDAGEHQQVRRTECAGADHHPIRIEHRRTVRPDAFGTDRAGSVEAQAQHPGVGEHRQVGPAHRRFEKGAAWPDAGAPVDVQRHGAHAGWHRRLRARSVQILHPGESRVLCRPDERRCAPVELSDPANGDRAAVTVQAAGEIEISFDRGEMRECVAPAPTRQRPAVEVGRQRPAEVTAVDSAGAPHDGTAHDLRQAARLLGEHRRVPPHHPARLAERQAQCIGDLPPHPGIGRRRTGLDHGDRGAFIGREPFRQYGTGAACPDDQNVGQRGRQVLICGLSAPAWRSRITPVHRPRP